LRTRVCLACRNRVERHHKAHRQARRRPGNLTGILYCSNSWPCVPHRLLVAQELYQRKGKRPRRRMVRFWSWSNGSTRGTSHSCCHPFSFSFPPPPPTAPLLLCRRSMRLPSREWRSRSGSAVRRWLDEVGEMEALNLVELHTALSIRKRRLQKSLERRSELRRGTK